MKKQIYFVLLAAALLWLITLTGCTATGKLPNGCPIKLYNNKPFKA